ncbi:MAG: hypothetical protein LAP13_27630, partial [Acidobacteriia bacterium]|nr:hypothetical protein [Terriglobia bacterium]
FWLLSPICSPAAGGTPSGAEFIGAVGDSHQEELEKSACRLDWMASQGVTMPLVLEGRETIWKRGCTAMGLTPAELDQACASVVAPGGNYQSICRCPPQLGQKIQ